MANELGVVYVTGKTVYGIVFNNVNQPLTLSPLAFGNYATASLAGYVISMTQLGTASGIYVANMPAIAAGCYTAVYYTQAGGSPAEGDTPLTVGYYEWNGSAIQSLVKAPINVNWVRGQDLQGDGSSGNPWRPA